MSDSMAQGYREQAEVPDDVEPEPDMPQLYGRQLQCPACERPAMIESALLWDTKNILYKWDDKLRRLVQSCKSCGYAWKSLPAVMRNIG